MRLDGGIEQASPRAPGGQDWAAGAAFTAILLAGILSFYLARGHLMLEDDARYYTLIAENIARSGRSTFDGQVLTNGYHPVWMALLVALAKTTGLSDGLIVGLELGLAGTGAALMLAAIGGGGAALRLVFAALLGVLMMPLVGRGMEVSVFLFAFGLFVFTLVRFRTGGAGALAMGLATGLAIGARLDSAVFILPLLVLVAGPRAALAPLAVAALCGALYAGANLMVFGIAFPVSGAIKSLGGVQVNQRVLQVLLDPLASGHPVEILRALVRTVPGKLVLAGAVAVALLGLPGHGAGRWLAAFLIGLALYLGKLFFGSSWVLWAWYGFPLAIGLFVIFRALTPVRPGIGGRPGMALACLLVLAAGGWVVRSNRFAVPPGEDFYALNRLAAMQLGPQLQGARVAMGDRAGSFAHHYPGPVTQTEGLVNDKAWLALLRERGDVKAALCARGVRFYLSYQKDLGDYRAVRVPVLRPALTSYGAPAITFSRASEVARIVDLSIYDSSKSDEGDSIIYVWRLEDCPA